jgi:hypothetical protein
MTEKGRCFAHPGLRIKHEKVTFELRVPGIDIKRYVFNLGLKSGREVGIY